ncbi:hypothetical protein RCL1_001306 [Eukaryota sp. TZLM3-RCL]
MTHHYTHDHSYVEDQDRTTIYENFLRSCEAWPNRPCFGTRFPLADGKLGDFQYITYSEANDWVSDVAHALHSTGITEIDMETPLPIPSINVGILGSNSASWVVCDLACQKLGLVTVPLYPSLKESEIVQVATNAQLSVLAVNEQNFQFAVDQVLPIVRPYVEISRPNVEPARLLIFLVDTPELSPESSARLSALMHFGVKILIIQQPQSFYSNAQYRKFCPICSAIDAGEVKINPDSPATIIYTSGSTGTPKGAVLSHCNITTALFGFRTRIPAPNCMIMSEDELAALPHESDRYHKVLSYLPLEHVLGRQIPFLLFLMGGSVCFWSQNPKLLADDIKHCRPSFFVGVPRVFHRIINGIFEKVQNSSWIKRKLFNSGLSTKLSNYDVDGTITHKLWDKLVFSKVSAALGGNCRLLVSGSAPLGAKSSKLLKILFSINISEGYGSTETSASITSQTYPMKSVGHVGSLLVPKNGLRLLPLEGMQMNNEENDVGKGELLVKGPTVFLGYYNDPEATSKLIDSSGWLHTGDVCRFDNEGQLHVVDRVGSIFKLANGLFLCPDQVESSLLKCRLLANIWVTGSSSLRYPVAVVWPSNELIEGWLEMEEEERQRVVVEKEEEMISTLIEDFQSICRADGLKGFEIPSRVLIALDNPTPQTGSWTPTFKPRRGFLKKQFEAELSKIFSEEEKGLTPASKEPVVAQESQESAVSALYACLPNLKQLPSFAQLSSYIDSLQLPNIQLPRNLFINLRRMSKDMSGDEE